MDTNGWATAPKFFGYGDSNNIITNHTQFINGLTEDDSEDWDLYSLSLKHWIEDIKAMEVAKEVIEVNRELVALPDEMIKNESSSEYFLKRKKSRLKRDIVLTYEGFNEISSLSQSQKLQVQEGNRGGYESMLHSLKTKIAPSLIEKYKDEFKRSTAQKIRDAIYLLEFIHAYKLGAPAANGKDDALKGWAYPKDELIIQQTGITKNELPKLKKLLVDERLLVIKKRKPKGGSEKDFYVPFYFPYDESYNFN